jgi:NADPH-dependent 2,4-dienoyl-CoA reductase/sulfur reductase-like enzyme
VVGAGPAGIAAAVFAAGRGLRVVVVDRSPEAGGQIWRHRRGGAIPKLAQEWIARLEKSGARVLRGTAVADACVEAGVFDVLADSSGSAVRISAASVILATGARELFIPFDGWTLPGVMGIGGAQALLKSGASFRDRRVVIAGSGPLMLPVAAALSGSGARLMFVAEQASRASVARFAAGLWRSPSTLLQAARYRARFLSAPYSTGTWVTAAHGSAHLESVTITDGRRTWEKATDILCTGYGLVPNIELAQLLGCETRDGAVLVDAYQRTTVANVLAVGEVTGIGGAPMSLTEGEIAGLSVGSRQPLRESLLQRRAAMDAAALRMAEAFALRGELRALPTADTMVCRCEDVRYGAVQGAVCSRQAKLYTRVGMGPCQGRTCMPGLEFLLAWQPNTVRPPIEPALVSTLSSELAESAVPPLSSHSNMRDAHQ